jgi:hypothetical protein
MASRSLVGPVILGWAFYKVNHRGGYIFQTNYMDELFTAFAKLLPAEMLIEQLEESIREYRATGSEDAKKRIAIWCSMFVMQVSTEGQDIDAVMADISEKKRILKAHEFSKH